MKGWPLTGEFPPNDARHSRRRKIARTQANGKPQAAGNDRKHLYLFHYSGVTGLKRACNPPRTTQTAASGGSDG